MKAFFALILTLVSATSFAASDSARKAHSQRVTKLDVLSAIATDSIGRAALKQLKGCEILLTKAPSTDFDNYEVEGSCSQPADEYTGGGIYLMIKIKGQYYSQKSGEIFSIEMMHAG